MNTDTNSALIDLDSKTLAETEGGLVKEELAFAFGVGWAIGTWLNDNYIDGWIWH